MTTTITTAETTIPTEAELFELAPPAFDTHVEAVSMAAALAQDRATSYAGLVHDAAGDRRETRCSRREYRAGRRTLGLSYTEAVRRVRQAGLARDIARIADVEAWVAELDRLLVLKETLRRIYIERGEWTRFWLVKNNGGHVHSSMACQTCNNGQTPTLFGWLPELSGQTEKEAVASQGAILCTVCFPSAPVEWTNAHELAKAARDAERCPNQSVPAGFDYRRRWATCTACGYVANVTSTGKLRAHKPPKAA